MTSNNYIFLFDVNHTLINTALYHTQVLPELEAYLAKHIDKKDANYIVRRFNEIFLLMVAGFLFRTDKEWKDIQGGKETYKKLIKLIGKHQVKVKQKWGFIKKWSREAFLKIAADEINVNIPPEIIYDVATVYWDSITNLTKPFSDAKEIVNYLTSLGFPVYLLTSSDGRLQIKNGYFYYDAFISGNYKKKRIEDLKNKGLSFKKIIVGDPQDKPLPEYYKRAILEIEKDLKEKVDPVRFVMVGNSFEDDLEIPMLLFKFGTGFLLDKKSKEKKETNFYRINNLLRIKDILNL